MIRELRKVLPFAIAGLLLTGIWVTIGRAAPEAGVVTVGFAPPDTTVVRGDVFTVAIHLETDADGIDSCETYVDFDPDHLRVVSPATGLESDQIIPAGVFEMEIEHDADNTAGEARYSAVTIAEEKPSGDFDVAFIPFKAISPTAQTILMFRGPVANFDGQALPLTILSGTVQVRGLYDLTVVADPPGGGTVTGSGTYSCCETITVTAVPTDDCWAFTGWLGDVDDAGVPTTTVHINGNKMVTATFERLSYELTVEKDPAEGGTVSGGGTYACGETATVTAVSADGWAFQGWVGDVADPDAASTTVLIDADKTVIATFTMAPGTLVGQVTTEFHGASGFPLIVKLVQGETLAFTHAVSLDAAGLSTVGTFTITGVPAGTYDVWVKHVHTLAQRADHVVIVRGDTTTVDLGLLREGDATDDNLINTTDFSLWLALFDTSDPRADFNLDGTVNTTDFSIWLTNFPRIGDPLFG